MKRFSSAPKKDSIEKKEAYRAAEIEQVWTHYRHVEDSRIKLFTGVMTLTLAATGFGLTQIQSSNIKNEWVFFGLSFFVLFLFVINFTSCAVFVQYDIQLEEYRSILSESRRVAFGTIDKKIDAVSIGETMPLNVRKYFFGNLSAFSLIAYSLSFILFSVSLVFASDTNFSKAFSSTTVGLVRIFAGLNGFALGVSLYGFLIVRSYWKTKRPKVWTVKIGVNEKLFRKPLLVRAASKDVAKIMALEQWSITDSGKDVTITLATSDEAKTLPDDQPIMLLTL